MKIGVIGYTGFVGRRLKYDPIDVDVTDDDNVRDTLKDSDYDLIIYAAGYTDVDKCEKNIARALDVNARGISNVLRWCYKKKIVYLSTDYVFSGEKNWFGWGYSENHKPEPVNNYGMSKLAGEMFCAGYSGAKVIRTSKLFDREYVLQHLTKKEVSDVLKRTFLHVDHFIEGLQFVLDNWEKIPIILNISGKDNLTYYQFLHTCAKHLGRIPPKPRKGLLYDAVQRPIRGGLNVRTARKLGVPLFSAYDGIELI